MDNKKTKIVKCDTSNFPKLEKEEQEKITKAILSNANIFILDEIPPLGKSIKERLIELKTKSN